MARKRLNISLSSETEEILRKLADETGLKLSTIVEKGIKLFEEMVK